MPQFVSLIISLILFVAPAYAEDFPDVGADHSQYDAVQFLREEGIIGGYPDGTYKPNNTVNRAEFTKIIVGAKLGENPEASAANCFPDVPADQWFASYVCYAKEQGIIGGYPDGTFKPADTINLVEAAKILVNTLQVPTEVAEGTEWYSQYLEAMGRLNYLPDSFSHLGQVVNRIQMADMTWRILEGLIDQPAVSAEALMSSACLPLTESTPSVDMDQVRETWLSWYNEVRGKAGLYPYVFNSQLHRTAIAWSEVSKDRGYMDHKRPGTTAYYDYNAITEWFSDFGLVFKNVNRVTHTENIGWGLFHCSDSECTDELIASIRDTFDFYMAEIHDEYRPHYNSVMNAYFKEIGLGIALDGNKYYLTVHYGTEITSNPLPVCGV